MEIDLSKVCNIEFDGVDTRDYPDFCDAYISSADIRVDDVIRPATEAELDKLNECKEWMYEKLMQSLY